MTVYEDGKYCFVCEKAIPNNNNKDTQVTDEQQQTPKEPETKARRDIDPRSITGVHMDLVDRGLDAVTLEYYGVIAQPDARDKRKSVRQFYPYYYDTGELAGYKCRNVVSKEFYWVGKVNPSFRLFGQELVAPKGKIACITEGEIDAMSVYQMTGYPAMSVSSASNALAECRAQMDYLNSFETIILAFDKDRAHYYRDGTAYYPGQEAAAEVASLFPGGKVKIMDMGTFKDPNEFLQQGETKLFRDQYYGAQPFKPKTIVDMSDTWDRLVDEDSYSYLPFPFAGLNERIFGLRPSELVTLVAGTGVGKTQFMKALIHHILRHTEENVGVMMLEEPLEDTVMGLMGIEDNSPLDMPDSGYDVREKQDVFKRLFPKGRVFCTDSFAPSDTDLIINTIRQFVKQYSCRYIILDHVSILVSGRHDGNERRLLDNIVTEIKALTIELGVCIIMASHLNTNSSGVPFEEGAQITLPHIRGTRAIGHLSNIVIALERDTQAADEYQRGTTIVRVLKSRKGGRTGVACKLFWDAERYTYIEMSEDEDPYDVVGPAFKNLHEKEKDERVQGTQEVSGDTEVDMSLGGGDVRTAAEH